MSSADDDNDDFDFDFDGLGLGLGLDTPSLPPPRLLPDDLGALFRSITRVANLRSVGLDDEPPYIFNGFETFDAKIGGMGLLIAGYDPKLDRKIAIKLWIDSDPSAHQRLLAEAKTLAKLSHPNVVTVYETGIWEGRVYFVMEWIDGQDGHDWILQRPANSDWREVQRVFLGAGQGLAAAHAQGIAHHDFKPANLLIGKDGRVLLADFGLAHSLWPGEADEPRAESGRPRGTPSYMAPERLRGEGGDARSDIFLRRNVDRPLRSSPLLRRQP